jgi:hypothetical protein
MSGALWIQGRKEIRALLPWWALAAAGIPALAWLVQPDFPGFRFEERMWTLMTYTAAVLGVAAVSMGQELSPGTLAGLLVQPVSRRRLLAIKIVVLTVALVTLGLVAQWAFNIYHTKFAVTRAARPLVVWGPIVAGIGMVPLLTILTRKALAGVVFAIVLPGLVFTAASASLPFSTDANGKVTFAPEVWAITWTGTMAASAVGLLLLILIFTRLQAVAPTAPMASPSQAGSADATFLRSRHRSWIWLAGKKELRLQRLTLAVSAFFLLVCGALSVAMRVTPDYAGPSFADLATLHAGFICLLAGALACAEERQIGTWSSDVLLPRASALVWSIKAAVTMAIALSLATALPLLARPWLDPLNTLRFEGELITVGALIVVAGIYVSSLSSNSLWALLAGFPSIAAVIVLGGLGMAPLMRWGARWVHDVAFSVPRLRSSVAGARLVEEGILIAAAAAVALVALELARRNYYSADRRPRTIASQVALLLASAVAAATLSFVARGLLWSMVT